MKKLSVIIASLVLFAGVSFAHTAKQESKTAPAQATQTGTKGTKGTKGTSGTTGTTTPAGPVKRVPPAKTKPVPTTPQPTPKAAK